MEKRAEDLKAKEPNMEKMTTEGEAGNGTEEGPEKEKEKKNQIHEVFNTIRRSRKCFPSF